MLRLPCEGSLAVALDLDTIVSRYAPVRELCAVRYEFKMTGRQLLDIFLLSKSIKVSLLCPFLSRHSIDRYTGQPELAPGNPRKDMANGNHLAL